ncbi:LysR family transcriptional regulator [Pelagibaculum spongiae]|nr:LysR family transcriptional regulator [Pelagibaculum spongiae]
MIQYLRHMSIFASVVDCGSISAAAESLDLSKSVISQHLKSLEMALKVSLLQRTTRRQQLTPAGQDFYLQCQKMQQLAKDAWQVAEQSRQEPAGPIRISAPHALIEAIIAPAIGQLCTEYAQIRPSLQANDQRVDLLEQEIDLAIRVGLLPSSNLKQRKLGSFRDVLCASKPFIERHQNQLDQLVTRLQQAEDTKDRDGSEISYELDLDYIANSWQGRRLSHALTSKTSRQTRTLQVSASRFTNSLPSVIAMAKAGAGIAIIPNFLLNNHVELEPICSDWQLDEVPIYSVHSYNQKPPCSVELSIEAIQKHLNHINPA